MKPSKIRLLEWGAPTNWDARMGPAIGCCNDAYFLSQEPWLEVKMSTMKECKEDGVMPWIRGGCRDEVRQCQELGIQLIVGPSCVFGNSNDPNANDPELKSPAIYRILMSDEVNGDLARSIATRPEIIKQVPFFMRPELYNEPFKYEKVWDAYFHIKTGGNKWAREGFKSITATFHGWYDFKELKYKAQHSTVCLHSCAYDNYGLAVHEISMLGCPLIYDKNGMKRGSIGPGMGIEVSDMDTENQELGKEIIEAAHKAMEMDRKKVWEASMEYQSIENCKRRYREAIFG